MKTALTALCILSLVAAPSFAEKKKPKKTDLEGTWVATKEKSQVSKIVFKGNTFVVTMGENTIKGTFKLNDNENPSHIDMKITSAAEEKFKGKTALGIYEFKGDNFRWCSSHPGRKRRPTQFKSVMGDARLLLVELKPAKKKK